MGSRFCGRRFLVGSMLLVVVSLLALSDVLGAGNVADEGVVLERPQVRSGMWWNPQRSGHGIDLHSAGGVLFLVWYTYDPEGLPHWYLAAAPWKGGTWSASLERYRWDAAAGVARPQTVGAVTLDFSDASHARFGWSVGDLTGSEPFEVYSVAGSAARDDHTGHWFVPAEPGYGLTVNDQGPFEFILLYFYDAGGNPRWVLGDNGGEAADTLQVRSYASPCPTCADLDVRSRPAGSIVRSFVGESHGTVTTRVSLTFPLSGDWLVQERGMTMLSDPPSGRAHDAALARFASAAHLEQYLRSGLADNLLAPFPVPLPAVDFAPPGDVAATVSQTNLQERGVDEADVVKSDGQHLYVHVPEPGRGVENRVRVLVLDGTLPDTSELSELRFGDAWQIPLRGMYLLTGRTGNAADLLVAVSSSGFSEVWPTLDSWPSPWVWTDAVTEVRLFDVSDPAEPRLANTLSLDGRLVASRRIGEALYLVTRHAPATGEEGSAGGPVPLVERGATDGLDDLLPDFRVDAEPAGELVDPATTYLPSLPSDYLGTDLITVSRIDLNDPTAPPRTATVVGQSEAVYASPSALYVATTRYGYGVSSEFLTYPTGMATDIHKFALSETGPVYRASASVPGHLGWDADNKKFRMGEREGLLRVVTSSDGAWGEAGQNRLTILQETSGALLAEVAHLPNSLRPQPIGKPAERLYGTRFVDRRLYAVTFLRTDPLIVIDLSEPADPRIDGQLEIPGYSDYLHPLGDDLLLGVGKDAVPSTSAGDGRFAWFQGVRVGLFNVADPASPVELDHRTIGRRGSNSEVLVDHHAFAYLSPDSAVPRPARFAVPVRVHDVEDSATISPDPAFSYPWMYTGLHLFEVLDGNRLSSPGAVIAADSSDPGYTPWADSSPGANRALLTAENVFYVLRGEVFSAPWEMPEQAIGPR